MQIGSVLENVGTTDVHVYKGKTTSGNQVIVHPGEKFGIKKEFNIITLSNPNLLMSAKVKTVVSH